MNMKAASTSVKRNGILIVMLMGAFVTILNQTLMNVALPSIMRDFGITASQGQWLSTGFMLVNGVMIPMTAFLIERFTTRQLYLFAMITFAIGTTIGGFATDYTMLIAGRMVQAIGAGIVMPLLTVVVLNLFPMERRGRAMGLIGLAMNFAPAIGPTLSGWIVEQYDWRNLFFIIIPFAILDIVVAIFLLKNVGKRTFPKLDVLGVIMSTIGFGSLLLGFSNAGDHAWLTWKVAGFIVLGLVVLGLFVRYQTSSKAPLLNFRVFKYPTFALTTSISFFVVMGLFGGMLLLPIFLQTVRGFSPLESGLVLLPGALVTAVLSPVTGVMFDRFGAKYLSLVGLIIMAGSTFMFTNLDESTTLTYIIIIQTIRSAGMAMVMMPLQTAALNSLPLNLAAHGSAMFNTMRQVAGSIGTAALITVMSKSAASFARHLGPEDVMDKTKTEIANHVLIHGIETAFLVAGILSVIACILALFIQKNNSAMAPIVKKTEEA
ncbi:multidrug efflux MFS transporter MdrM [Listeria seeligeri]|uniref:Lincomycin resistance protein LmrB n=2 Tax=Listeria seeligeri TaxID=1640 RepID=E3ZR13_LISSE|nr:multidrug efflux MFS transporter MdrM [Listeria seeligeri]EFR99919.1 lincomycin resistance protein LmrB [Listeria seeligeri FSL N1-067]MBC1594275.1 multidrug efflux MFS transporter [Listeria seeligeri]MBC1914416.1 multidrug efflux MFS transporter [Listeria seeligeri]MBC1932753.1 multidrug efflux MFS transporter [Listeria seeligeri]MBC1990970.1 multidrug efflux MFS transporter [Listeria seeligeri]